MYIVMRGVLLQMAAVLQSEESEEGEGRVGSKHDSLASTLQSMVHRGQDTFCTDDDHEVRLHPFTQSTRNGNTSA